MQTEFITHSDFIHFLEARVRERIEEIISQIKAFEYIKRDRGLLPYEKARYLSLGKSLEINEKILKEIDSEYISFQ